MKTNQLFLAGMDFLAKSVFVMLLGVLFGVFMPEQTTLTAQNKDHAIVSKSLAINNVPATTPELFCLPLNSFEVYAIALERPAMNATMNNTTMERQMVVPAPQSTTTKAAYSVCTRRPPRSDMILNTS